MKRESVKQELRRMDRILKHVQKLTPESRSWMMDRLQAVECAPGLVERVRKRVDATRFSTSESVYYLWLDALHDELGMGDSESPPAPQPDPTV